jgi:GNAT superfamily N-acetyltransferase
VSDFVGPELLDEHHVLDGFDSGDDGLNAGLTGKARRNQVDGSSRTWVVTTEGRVVAFYASSTAVLLRAEATRGAARNQPDPLPALLVGRPAVEEKWQGHGLGAALLKHFILKSLEVAQITGVRALIVHARTNQVAELYLRHGFEPSPVDELTLMLLVNDITA